MVVLGIAHVRTGLAARDQDRAEGKDIGGAHGEVFFGGVLAVVKALHGTVLEIGENLLLGKSAGALFLGPVIEDLAVADNDAGTLGIAGPVGIEIVRNGEHGIHAPRKVLGAHQRTGADARDMRRFHALLRGGTHIGLIPDQGIIRIRIAADAHLQGRGQVNPLTVLLVAVDELFLRIHKETVRIGFRGFDLNGRPDDGQRCFVHLGRFGRPRRLRRVRIPGWFRRRRQGCLIDVLRSFQTVDGFAGVRVEQLLHGRISNAGLFQAVEFLELADPVSRGRVIRTAELGGLEIPEFIEPGLERIDSLPGIPLGEGHIARCRGGEDEAEKESSQREEQADFSHEQNLRIGNERIRSDRRASCRRAAAAWGCGRRTHRYQCRPRSGSGSCGRHTPGRRQWSACGQRR